MTSRTPQSPQITPGGPGQHRRNGSGSKGLPNGSSSTVVPAQPHASSSKLPMAGNPQLTSSPWFAYPTPSAEVLDEELPPYHEGDNVPLGPLLDRVVKKGYGDLRELVEVTLPPLSGRQKPSPIITYAQTTRQAVLKYLAALRWKAQVDTDVYSSSQSAATQVNGYASNQGNGIGSNGYGPTGMPTPHSSSDTTDSPEYAGKGKGKALESADDAGRPTRAVLRGRVTDAKRIEVFMAHQNAQQAAAIDHLRHTAKVVDGLRLRNPDLLTAVSILSTGTYTRLPTSLTDSFLPKPPLTNRRIMATLRRLNRHIRFRLRCEEYIPPELHILGVRDGKMYVEGGGAQWRAELTIINFGDIGQTTADVPGSAVKGRWWLTGVEWGWREGKRRGVDDPGGPKAVDENRGGDEEGRRRLLGEERKEVLDLANMSVLNPREVQDSAEIAKQAVTTKQATRHDAVSDRAGVASSQATPASVGGIAPAEDDTVIEKVRSKVDAPLVRAYNFLQHLCLIYQLEVLTAQALVLASGQRRGQLLVNLDRAQKVLRLQYWLRPRPPVAPPGPTQAAVGKRNVPQAIPNNSRTPMVGGIITISLAENPAPRDEADSLLAEVRDSGLVPCERVLGLHLAVKWEVGEVGEGAGWKVGETLDSGAMQIDPFNLSVDTLISTASRLHASHLTRHYCQSLLTLPRIFIFPLTPPTLQDSQSQDDNPLSLQIPLPSSNRSTYLSVGVSSVTGLIEIEDTGALPIFVDPTTGSSARVFGMKGNRGMEDRGARAKLASSSVNEGKTRLGDDIGRLVTAIITENIENQLRALGHSPVRKLAVRTQDMAKNDLHPASSIFLPLPTSKMHHLVIKVTSGGITFELLQLVRIPAENGVGMKLAVGQRAPIDLSLIRNRRQSGSLSGTGGGEALQGYGNSTFVLESRDLRDVFIYSNALVAQSLIEFQLKTRNIPYSLQLPASSGQGAPKSRSPIAGMVPTFIVNAPDLLKDGRAGDVAMPRVILQIRDWWKGGACSVVTIVQLQHRPSGGNSVAASPAAPTNSSKAARAEGFLEQWERLSKVIVIAGGINKLNKLPGFKDVRMLSFDLRTATIAYYPGYFCSITYDPSSDSYVVSFAKAFSSGAHPGHTPALGLTPLPSATPATTGLTPAAAATPGQHGLTPGAMSAATPGSLLGGAEGNPHAEMAGLMSWRLNELVAKGRDVAKQFIGLLRATLPFLLEVEDIRQSSPSEFPALVIFSTHHYRLIWDVDNTKRYGVDVTLLKDNTSWVVTDGSRPVNGLLDGSCGPLEAVPDFERAIDTVWRNMNEQLSSESASVSPTASLGRTERIQPAPLENGAKNSRTAVKLDGGMAMLSSRDIAIEAIRGVVKEVQSVLSTGPGDA